MTNPKLRRQWREAKRRAKLRENMVYEQIADLSKEPAATIEEIRQSYINDEPAGGYVVIKVKFGKQWRKLFFRLVEE